MVGQPRAPASAAELVRLASELDMAVLTFPSEPDDEMQTAARILQAACQRVAAACVSACVLLRLPQEALLRVLRELKANDLAALAATCHAVNEGAPSVINRGAQDAITHQYSTELAALPPRHLRAQGQLRWLERAALEAQRWLKFVGRDSRSGLGRLVWPKAVRLEDSTWMEAVARFGGDGLDMTIGHDDHYLHNNEPGQYARQGVRAALFFMLAMATRTAREANTAAEQRNVYDDQHGPLPSNAFTYPAPTISVGAVQWVAAQVPSLRIEHELPIAQKIMDSLMGTLDSSWKLGSTESVFLAWEVKCNYGVLLHALLDARIASLGADSMLTLQARVTLGEVLASASAVQKCPDKPNTITSIQWGDIPRGEADAVTADALASMRRLSLDLIEPLAVRIVTARAARLSQRGLFAEAAALLAELLDAFVRLDGGYTSASWGNDYGLAYQIQAVASHTRTAAPDSDALLAGCGLLRAHCTALRNYAHDGHYDLVALYLDDDLKLLLSHLRRVEGGTLLSEAEALARELVAKPKYEWDIQPKQQLLKVLAAQAALGWDGKATAVQECRAELCSAMIADINDQLHPAGADLLFGNGPLMGRFGYYRDGSGHDLEEAMTAQFKMKAKYVREYGIADEIEQRQTALVEERRGQSFERLTPSEAQEAAREVYKAQGRLVQILLVQGKFDAAIDELCQVLAAADDVLGVTDTFAEDAFSELGRMHGLYRTSEAAQTICSTDKWEGALRSRVAACQEGVEELQSLSSPVLNVLTNAALDLTKLLRDAQRGDQVEGAARFAVTAAQAWEKSIRTNEAEPDNDQSRTIFNVMHMQCLALQILRDHLSGDAERLQDYEAAIIDELSLTRTMLEALQERDVDENDRRFSRFMVKQQIPSLIGSIGVGSLRLAHVRMVMGRHDEAQQLAQQLVDDSSGEPLVRARAMHLLAVVLLHKAEDEAVAEQGASGEDASGVDPPQLGLLGEQAESMFSRASVLFNGMLEQEVAYKEWGSESLEWSELYNCLEMQETALIGLNRCEAAEEVRARRWSIFNMDGEEDEEGEEGEEGNER